MYMTCLKGVQKKTITQDVGLPCVRACSASRKSSGGQVANNIKIENSNLCRTTFFNATGRDVQPTFDVNAKPPKHSPREQSTGR